CHAIAFIAPPEHEFYIAPDAAYLWVNDDDQDAYRSTDCIAHGAGDFAAGQAGVLYRAPFDGSAPGVMRIRGTPRDQLGLASTATKSRACLPWSSSYCSRTSQWHVNIKYFSAPISAFASALGAEEPTRFHDAPGLEAGMYEERFTDNYVVYGARQSWYSPP